jgi:hypothetical protein
MNEENKNNQELTIKQIRKEMMTDEEKISTWDGIFRRTTDYPDGQYPFEKKQSTWDGIKRRKSDYPDGIIPPEILALIAREKEERDRKAKEDAENLGLGGDAAGSSV